MVDIPNNLKSVFTATIQQDGRFKIDVPINEIETGNIKPGQQYRVAIIESRDVEASTLSTSAEDPPNPASNQHGQSQDEPSHAGPPVEEGEMREVTIESLGDDGDGIAKVGGGYVVIVPETTPGEQPIVEINRAKPNVAFATVAEPSAAHR